MDEKDKWRWFRTPERRYNLVLGASAGIVALFIGAIPLVAPVDAMGLVFVICFTSLSAAIATLRLVKAFKAPKDAVIYLHPEAAPEPLRRAGYRRLLWATIIAFPVMTAFTAWDLWQLERGAVERVSLWAPLAFLYDWLGYVPTVVFVPLLGLVCIAFFVHQLKKKG